MSYRWHVLVNRSAGATPSSVDTVAIALRTAGIDFELVDPDGAEDMVEAIEHAVRSGVGHLALVGGDGTVNLAANTLLKMGDLDKADRPVLAVLPAGTGCDLLRTFGLPQDIGAASRHLATDNTYDIDVATVEGTWGIRYFVNVAQTGVGAAAVETSSRVPRRIGAARYPVAFAARLPAFPRAEVTVTTEKRTYESPALAVIMANAQFFGGGWNVAPRATLVDGVIDLQVINAMKMKAPALLPKLIRGTHLSDPAVRRFTAARFEVVTSVPWPVEVDGDHVGNTPVRGRVLPAALTLKI